MNRNAANWGLLLGLLILGSVAYTVAQGRSAVATAAPGDVPLAQATSTPTRTPTPNPANREQRIPGAPPFQSLFIPNGDGTFSQSTYCTNCASAVGAGTPVTGNPQVVAVQDYSGNAIVPVAGAVDDLAAASLTRLQTSAQIVAYDSANNLVERVRIEPTRGALLVAPPTYAVAVIGTVTTPTAFQNVLPACRYNATPVTIVDGQWLGCQADANGSVRVVSGGYLLKPSSNPTLSVAASYVSGDYIGTSATPWSWTACRTSGGTGQLQSVTVVDKAAQSIAGELWLFDRSVTVPNDSAAWTITDADAQFLLGVVPVSTYYASAANSVASVTGVGMPIWCNGSSTVYGAWVTRGAPSYASGDLTIILGVSAD